MDDRHRERVGQVFKGIPALDLVIGFTDGGKRRRCQRRVNFQTRSFPSGI